MSEQVREEPEIPAAQAEVELEPRQRPDGRVSVPLPTGRDVWVPMQSRWRKSAQDFIRLGDFDSWAESVLLPEDLDAWDEWMAADPEMGEITEFFEDLGKATGMTAATNRASRRSLQRTQRR